MISYNRTNLSFRPFTLRVLEMNYIAMAPPCLRSEDYGSDSTGGISGYIIVV